MLEKTIEKLFYTFFPIVVFFFIIHLIIFIGAWILIGSEDPKFQGKIGVLRYYFHIWREAFTKVTFEEKQEER